MEHLDNSHERQHIRVSVVICTWNRCELLRSTLESLQSLVVPADQEWEVLVVNNNCSDATDGVIAQFQDLLPLRRLFERELGVSRARNTGVRAATGQLLLFTDDDVQVDPNWLTAYVEAARVWPDAQYFGGVIRPRFAAGVPRWVKRNQATLNGMLCSLDLGPISRRFQAGESPYSGNMAVRREAFTVASFDEQVGRIGREQVRGGEISLFRSLERLGIAGVWAPAAKVYHYVPGCRANFKYLWDYYHGNGRCAVRLGVSCEMYSRWHLGAAGLRALAEICLRPANWPSRVASVAWMSGHYAESKKVALRNGAAQGEHNG